MSRRLLLRARQALWRQRLRAHIVCTPALSDEIGGRIDCQVEECAPSALSIDWLCDGHAAFLELSNDRLHARNVPPGTYELVLRRGDHETRVVAKVERVGLVAVTASWSTPPRHGVRRLRTVQCTSGEPVRFLWTPGAITEGPAAQRASGALRGVPDAGRRAPRCASCTSSRRRRCKRDARRCDFFVGDAMCRGSTGSAIASTKKERRRLW